MDASINLALIARYSLPVTRYRSVCPLRLPKNTFGIVHRPPFSFLILVVIYIYVCLYHNISLDVIIVMFIIIIIITIATVVVKRRVHIP